MNSASSGFGKRSQVHIAVGQLTVHWPEAQRDLAERKAAAIAKEFDPDFFGVITVSGPLPGGKYHVDDGWTRVSAVRQLWGDSEKVPCQIVPATTAQRAAQIFDKMNSGRQKPSYIQLFKVRVTAGEPVEVAVDRIARDLGFRVDVIDSQGYIRAAQALVGVFKQHGEAALRDTLRTIEAVWGKDNAAYDQNLIRGFAMLLTEEGAASIDRMKLAKRVQRKFTPGTLVAQGRSVKDAFGGQTARAICEALKHLPGTGRGAAKTAA